MKQNGLLCIPVVDGQHPPLEFLFAADALEALLLEFEYE